jgi:hypothetical protein
MSQGVSEQTAGVVAAEIELLRMNWSGSFLVVEGVTDSKFWRTRKNDLCDLVIAQGRRMVLNSLSILNSRAIQGVLGIVDDDFDALLGNNPLIENVISTDPRDLEGVLLRARALEKVLAEYADANRLATFLAVEGGCIREAILRRTILFGRIRWINEVGTQANLESLKPLRFCDVATWSYDEAAIMQEAVKLHVAQTVEELSQQIGELPPADPWLVCRGHDLIDVLLGGLLGVLGGADARRPAIESMLRSGLEGTELQSTQLYKDIRNWETTNSPFQILI